MHLKCILLSIRKKCIIYSLNIFTLWLTILHYKFNYIHIINNLSNLKLNLFNNDIVSCVNTFDYFNQFFINLNKKRIKRNSYKLIKNRNEMILNYILSNRAIKGS